MSEANRVRKREGESVNISQETKKTLRSLESLEPADLKLAKQSRKREKDKQGVIVTSEQPVYPFTSEAEL